MGRYVYFKGTDPELRVIPKMTEAARRLSRERQNPKLSNPDFLVFWERRRLFLRYIERLPDGLRVLDVGGRIQPYRPFLEEKCSEYFAVDPQLNGLVSAVAIGEQLPFPDASFDLVICTQVLSYVHEPSRVVEEIQRVLKTGGYLFLSAPAFFPPHHDEHWRFLPEGLRLLLRSFSSVEISPEGYSVAGFFRTVNVCLDMVGNRRIVRWILGHAMFPLTNMAGLLLDWASFGNRLLTTNYNVLARK